MPAADVRRRVVEAGYVCIARYGISKTTVEDICRVSGVARATVYRHFPGGRDQIVRDVISWEAGRFFARLADAAAGAASLEQLLEETLVFARRAMLEHEVLQKVLDTEPELLLPQLTVESARLLAFVRAFLASHVGAGDVRPGMTTDEAAEFLARLVLSYIAAPGHWDLSDRDQVRRLVRTEMLAAVAPPAGPTRPAGGSPADPARP